MPNIAPNRDPAQSHRRAVLTAVLLGLVALAFYFGYIVLMHYRHI